MAIPPRPVNTKQNHINRRQPNKSKQQFPGNPQQTKLDTTKVMTSNQNQRYQNKSPQSFSNKESISNHENGSLSFSFEDVDCYGVSSESAERYCTTQQQAKPIDKELFELIKRAGVFRRSEYETEKTAKEILESKKLSSEYLEGFRQGAIFGYIEGLLLRAKSLNEIEEYLMATYCIDLNEARKMLQSYLDIINKRDS